MNKGPETLSYKEMGMPENEGTFALEVFLTGSRYCSAMVADETARRVAARLKIACPKETPSIMITLKQSLLRGFVDIDEFHGLVSGDIYLAMKVSARHLKLLRDMARDKALHPHRILDLILDVPDAVKWRNRVDADLKQDWLVPIEPHPDTEYVSNPLAWSNQEPNTQSAPESNKPS